LVGWRTVGAETLLDAIKAVGGVRQPEWFSRVTSVVAECASVDLSGLVSAGERVANVSSESFRKAGLEGQALGRAIDAARADLIRAAQAVT
jgi:hypothetical protein